MSVFNDARYLSQAIESVLVQSHADFELVIVNDGSTDDSRNIITSYRDERIRLVDLERNVGLGAALNRGLEHCRGDLVARLDGNDCSLPSRLEKQVAWMSAHPGIVAVGSQVLPIDTNGAVLRRVGFFNGHWRKPAGGVALDWYRMFDTPFIHSSVMFRRAAVMAIGGYDENHRIAQDAELWMRLAASGGLANLQEALVVYRIDFSSLAFDSGPERGQHVQQKIRIVQRLLEEGLEGPVPERWARLWIAVNEPSSEMDAESLRELSDSISEAARRFDALHRDADSDGVARHRASMYGRMAEKALVIDRSLGKALYGRMLGHDRATALRSFPRMAMFLAFGSGLRRVLDRRRSRLRNAG
jgi:glycosyltransferase involved in cell wall biosynthesis